MNAFLDWFLDILFPAKCMFCGKLMQRSDEQVCGACLEDLPEYDGAPPAVPYFEKTVAPFYYQEQVRDSIIRFKFHGMAQYSDAYAKWMAIWVRDKLDGRYDVISWVPCSRKRRWSRGYDQAEVLAKALGEALHTEVVQTLKKTRNNPKQSGIHNAAARRANVLGVYVPYLPERIYGKKILLVDDVLTTGATLSECGKVLRMAGSGDLVCAVIAVTVRENNK